MTTTATKERPMLFRPELVAKILAKQKTQTRRIIKPQPIQKAFGACIYADDWAWPHRGSSHHFTVSNKPNGPEGYAKECPYGKVGDRLWVREPWGYFGGDEYLYQRDRSQVVYRAQIDFWHGGWTPNRWRPSIHMPRWACRALLEITDVRVERLQSISGQDAIAEGYERGSDRPRLGSEKVSRDNARQWFSETWNAINGKPRRVRWEDDDGKQHWRVDPPVTWESNPWVWAITFKLLDKDGSP